MKTLLVGYGNVDRQDDGVAWHVLVAIAAHFGHPDLSLEEDLPTLPGGPDLTFMLQLTPELAETLAGYDRIGFIDAHTGNIAQDVNLAPVQPEFQTSPFTHHLTPATALAITDALYHRQPQAVLLSVRGYEFGFVTSLSSTTQALLPQATQQLLHWLSQGGG